MTAWLRCPKRKGNPKVAYEACLFNCGSKSRFKGCKIRKEFEKDMQAYGKLARKMGVYFEG